jgi:hypothetical protein
VVRSYCIELEEQKALNTVVSTEVCSYEQVPLLLTIAHDDDDPEGLEYLL